MQQIKNLRSCTRICITVTQFSDGHNKFSLITVYFTLLLVIMVTIRIQFPIPVTVRSKGGYAAA